VINEIKVLGVVLDAEDKRFLQPSIGKELYFQDGLSVTVRQVVIDPHNRRVVGIVVLGQLPGNQQLMKSRTDSGKVDPERLVVIPMSSVQHLTRGTGLLNVESTETDKFKSFDPAQFVKPNPDWLPPYPYCPSEVLIPLV
jgi:sporulation protein YlmC with PRC-barrel domain